MVSSDAQLERLLAEAEWIRRLARALVGAEEGDDLAQDAWVAVLRRRPDPARPPRPWLWRVVANLRATRARAAVRRLEREAAWTDETSAPADPETLAARMEVQARLAALVVSLPEPLRATVIARYYEGRSAAAIAKATGVPPGTVRWRVKRALALLRERMDEAAAGRDWRRALLPLAAAGRWSGRAGRTLLLGGAVMKGLKSAVVAVLLLLALGLLWRWQPWRGRAGDGAPSIAGGQPAGRAPRRSGGPGTDPGPASRELPSWFLQKAAPSRRVAGHVVADGKPVGGATVTLASVLTEAGYLPEPSVETGPDGRFDLGTQPPARYTVSASAPGFTAAVQEIALADPAARPAPDALVLELGSCTGSLTGVVRDASGGVIEGAAVRRALNNAAFGPRAVTDVAGRYALCATGNLIVEVTAAGYGGLMVSARVLGRTMRDFVLVPEAQVFGRVVRRADGSPVPRAHVFLYTWGRAAERGASRRALTDAQGRFRLDQVAPGRHRIGAYGDGVMTTSQAVVQVTPGELAPEITLVVDAAVDVSGTVVAGGTPVTGAEVSLPAFPAAVSQKDGRFVIQDVTAGSYALEVAGYRVLSPTAITVGPRPLDVRVEVAPLGGIRGRVLRAGRAAEGANVTALGGRRGPFEATTRAGGTFELAGLDAGTYSIYASSEPLGAFANLRVTHAQGAFEQVELELEGAASIAGRVLDADGRPVPRVCVRWQRDDGDQGEDVTDEAGRYLVRLLAGSGRYRAEVRRTPLAAVLLPPASRFPVVTLPEGESHPTDIVLRIDTAGAAIAGRTVMRGASPLADVKVVAVPAGRGVSTEATWIDLPTTFSAADGSFTLDGLSPGSYDVRATAPSGATGTATGVAAGTRDLTIELPSAGSVDGTLRGFSAPPVVFVQLRAGGRRVLAEVRGTDFRVPGLTPGSYVVVAQSSGEAAAAAVEVRPAESTTVTLPACATAAIDVEVTEDGSRAPLPGVRCGVVPRLAAGGDDPQLAWLGAAAQSLTDEDGRLSLESVPSGEVVLVCQPNPATHRAASAALTLSPGGRERASVAIRRSE